MQQFKNYIKEGRLIILDGSLDRCGVLDESDNLRLIEEKVSEIWHLAGQQILKNQKERIHSDVMLMVLQTF